MIDVSEVIKKIKENPKIKFKGTIKSQSDDDFGNPKEVIVYMNEINGVVVYQELEPIKRYRHEPFVIDKDTMNAQFEVYQEEISLGAAIQLFSEGYEVRAVSSNRGIIFGPDTQLIYTARELSCFKFYTYFR